MELLEVILKVECGEDLRGQEGNNPLWILRVVLDVAREEAELGDTDQGIDTGDGDKWVRLRSF